MAEKKTSDQHSQFEWARKTGSMENSDKKVITPVNEAVSR